MEELLGSVQATVAFGNLSGPAEIRKKKITKKKLFPG